MSNSLDDYEYLKFIEPHLGCQIMEFILKKHPENQEILKMYKSLLFKGQDFEKQKEYKIYDEKQIEELDIDTHEKISIVSQTTFNHNKFKYLVEIINKKESSLGFFKYFISALTKAPFFTSSKLLSCTILEDEKSEEELSASVSTSGVVSKVNNNICSASG